MKPLALRNILVATDLSPEMKRAIASARELADLSGAQLHILHSIEAGSTAAGLDERMARTLAAANARMDITVLTGPAGALIGQESARTQADVIVLGRHRNRAGQPGSTADRVIRTAEVPCLILPADLPLPLAAVLVPVDIGSARGALEVALTWASALRRRQNRDHDTPTCVEALHVLAGHSATEEENLRARLEAEVASIRDRLSKITGVTIEQHFVNDTDIVGAILNRAETQKANLVVLGTRRERNSHDSLGSVSSAVVKRITKPVLLVPPKVWRSE